MRFLQSLWGSTCGSGHLPYLGDFEVSVGPLPDRTTHDRNEILITGWGAGSASMSFIFLSLIASFGVLGFWSAGVARMLVVYRRYNRENPGEPSDL